MKKAPIAIFALLPAGAWSAEEDVILRALGDELGRSVERLRLERHPGPYYLAYQVKEKDSCHLYATFGALTDRGRRRSRGLAADVRVGDYALDSSHFMEGGFGFDGMFERDAVEGLTADDDYLALRHAIWLKTDEAYKEAIEKLEAKKAYLQENKVQDRPDDLSREKPVVSLLPPVRLEVDEEHWAARARKVSAVFRDFPRVQRSVVIFQAEAENRWQVNNEGFQSREGKLESALAMLAAGQADDGMPLFDFEVFTARTAKGLPSEEETLKAARALGERITRLTGAPPAEEYRGPILLEGQAAAEFFAQVLSPNLGRSHEPLGAKGEMAFLGANGLREKIGQRILPASISVVDDPTAREFGGVPLLGGYQVDDDGLAAQRIGLVEKGTLKTFCMSRIPTRQLKQSNGHSRGGVGAPSILFVKSDSPLPRDQLGKKLLDLAKEEDLQYALVARKISNASAALLSPQSMLSSLMSRMGGGEGIGLLPPIALYRVSLKDGSEELLRGGQFGSLTLRVLRDIAAAGDDPAAHLVLRGMGEGAHLVTPSILIKEIEVRKPAKENEKLPELKNAYFEK